MFDQEPTVQHCLVDNRFFLLGLDELYRRAIKPHERGELLKCAQVVAQSLDIAPSDVPIEGYYAEDEALSMYFLLMRALQAVDKNRSGKVEQLSQYHRLQEVTRSPVFGVLQSESESILPRARDALAHALQSTRPDWTIERLTDVAYEASYALDDISLSGLAALTKDTVVIASLRETVVLYIDSIPTGVPPPITYEFEWRVDDFLAAQATRFVEAFADLFHDDLPKPEAVNAESYWRAAQSNRILGRCVTLGFDDRVSPVQNYHWAICQALDGRAVVQEFWSAEIWTTVKYREQLGRQGDCLEF